MFSVAWKNENLCFVLVTVLFAGLSSLSLYTAVPTFQSLLFIGRKSEKGFVEQLSPFGLSRFLL